MTRILAYADRLSATPGDTLQIKVSCDALTQYEASLIRVIHGDINPAGPGYREDVVPVNLGGPFTGRYQPINTGSCVVVDKALGWGTHSSIAVRLLVLATLPASAEQTLLSQADPSTGTGFRLYLDPRGAVACDIHVNNERCASVTTDAQLVSHRWYAVSASYDAEQRSISVAQQPLLAQPNVRDSALVSVPVTSEIAKVTVTAPILIAAHLAKPTSVKSFDGHFNGRIEAPRLFSRALSPEEMLDTSTGAVANGLTAAWDFSIGISTDQVTDTSVNALHGRLVNLPTRSVPGHAWNGDEHCWQNKPDHYAAIHFHDDDLYDCEWKTDFDLNLPEDLASGVYAVRLYAEDDEFYVPFAVRPPKGTVTAPVALVLPTVSYMAYANNRIGIDVPETEIVCGRLLQMNQMDLFMQSHPELGLCFYDLHNDGSGVYYSSRLRPIVNMQPKQFGHLGGAGSNVWQFNADTHILDWLEQLGQPFDVITDEDLHHEGESALAGYTAVITGSHPEYYSAGMMDSIQGYLNGGGRLMYLGGNGFYWRVSFHPTLPGVVECRKSEDGIRAFAPQPGEFYASFTGEYTGLWRRNGRAPNALVGVGMVSQGFDYSAPYMMTDACLDPRARFIFEGVQGPQIGDYGLSGGGAAGLELDATDHTFGTPPHTLVLAKSQRHSDVYLMTPEDMNDPAPGIAGSEAEIIRAEMVFFETPAGGAVFSTGSIAWCGSLSHDDYQNDVARITANVLQRFLDDTTF